MHDICKILPKLPALGSLEVQWPQINVVELPTSAHNSLVRLCATYFRRANPAQATWSSLARTFSGIRKYAFSVNRIPNHYWLPLYRSSQRSIGAGPEEGLGRFYG